MAAREIRRISGPPFNRGIVLGADIVKWAYFKTTGLFDYAESQETNSGDATDDY